MGPEYTGGVSSGPQARPRTFPGRRVPLTLRFSGTRSRLAALPVGMVVPFPAKAAQGLPCPLAVRDRTLAKPSGSACSPENRKVWGTPRVRPVKTRPASCMPRDPPPRKTLAAGGGGGPDLSAFVSWGGGSRRYPPPGGGGRRAATGLPPGGTRRQVPWRFQPEGHTGAGLPIPPARSPSGQRLLPPSPVALVVGLWTVALPDPAPRGVGVPGPGGVTAAARAARPPGGVGYPRRTPVPRRV